MLKFRVLGWFFTDRSLSENNSFSISTKSSILQTFLKFGTS